MIGRGILVRLGAGAVALALVGRDTSAALAADTVRITIDKLAFSPAEVSVRVGDTIEWENHDFVAHTATARSNAWNVMIPAGKTGQQVISKAGTVEYYCRFHPNMTGRIIAAGPSRQEAGNSADPVK